MRALAQQQQHSGSSKRSAPELWRSSSILFQKASGSRSARAAAF
jgi:hypothetical protein